MAGFETRTFGPGERFKSGGDRYIFVREALDTTSDNDGLIIVSDAREDQIIVPDETRII